MKNSNDLEISVLIGDKLFNENTPFIININTPKLKTATKMCNADLICVIDISGSMFGTKLDMVQKSLIILIKLMDENDRLALVLFESKAQVLCNLEYMTETKKQEFISKVNQIKSGSTTNILSGLEKAVEVLKNIKSNKDDKRASSMILKQKILFIF
jgi:Mg-chelatase subunit ChlD